VITILRQHLEVIKIKIMIVEAILEEVAKEIIIAAAAAAAVVVVVEAEIMATICIPMIGTPLLKTSLILKISLLISRHPVEQITILRPKRIDFRPHEAKIDLLRRSTGECSPALGLWSHVNPMGNMIRRKCLKSH
jgi:hypothetical protein